MISYEEALSIVLDNVQVGPGTRVKLEKLLGSVLGEPVLASYDLPHFDNSGVDGFAVCLADVLAANEDNPVEMEIAGEIRAGDVLPGAMPSGLVYKIFTGAPVPEGADAVVMREYCIENGKSVKIGRCPRSGDNIRRRGEEFLRGKQILPEGVRITPSVMGLLASLGQASVMVRKKPTVAIVSTGNELVKPGKPLTPGKIFDSNSFALTAALESIGIDEFLPLHCREDLNETKKVLGLALDFADVVITAGGVSVGDHDYVKPVLEELGVKTLVYKVAMKPGKPFYFGATGPNKKGKRQYVFGLPGNPVSALVTYHQLVKPAVLKIMGDLGASTTSFPHVFNAVLSADITRKQLTDRLEFLRAVVYERDDQLIAEPCEGQDSHMLGGLARANSLIIVPTGSRGYAAGDKVQVVRLDWHS